MQLTTVIITRNKSASVKTLHSLLRLNIICLENNIHNRIVFADDKITARRAILQKNLKHADRILWIEYGVYVDDESLKQVIDGGWNWHGLVFPCVTEGIDWDMFRQKVDSDEHMSQRGLNFDTQVDKKLRDSFYTVMKTDPKCWCIDTKNFLKNYKKDKIPPEMSMLFSELADTKFKTVAYTGARLIVMYPHECVGNILNASGVSHN